jgi:hypothetical protein
VTTATAMSFGSSLPTRLRPLRPADLRGIGPAVDDSIYARSGSSTTSGSEAVASLAVALSRSPCSTLPPTRMSRRTRRFSRIPRIARTARPTRFASSSKRLDSGAVCRHPPLGLRVLRCACHEGSGLQTRAFTFSDRPRLLRARRACDRCALTPFRAPLASSPPAHSSSSLHPRRRRGVIISIWTSSNHRARRGSLTLVRP